MKLPRIICTWLLAQRDAEQRAPFVPHLSRVPDIERIGSWGCCRCCVPACGAIHRQACDVCQMAGA